MGLWKHLSNSSSPAAVRMGELVQVIVVQGSGSYRIIEKTTTEGSEGQRGHISCRWELWGMACTWWLSLAGQSALGFQLTVKSTDHHV